MKRICFAICACLLAAMSAWAQTAKAAQAVQSADFNPQEHRVVRTDRADGRHISTYGVAHAMLKNTTPKYAFHSDFTPDEMRVWQQGVRSAMEEIMCFPDVTGQPEPVCVLSEEKDGYRQEKWEFYPLPECVSTFYILIPDSVQLPSPAVLCIPGAGMSKENIIGATPSKNPHLAMAKNIAQHGYIAVAVDNAAAGEADDLGRKAHGGYDYDTPSRILLELGWSWLGYTSYLDKQVLEWMKQQPYIRADRIVVSGFSLGTEPLMVLGVIDPTIYAFVYNDFLCQTQERAIVMTVPDEKGRRNFPNSIRHLIPRWWKYFNFPDVVASLAPRHIILTEGGLDRDFDVVKRAYEISGHPENVEAHHYPKYASSESRTPYDTLPEGMTREEFFEAANVDSKNHYYKDELILPWLDKVLQE